MEVLRDTWWVGILHASLPQHTWASCATQATRGLASDNIYCHLVLRSRKFGGGQREADWIFCKSVSKIEGCAIVGTAASASECNLVIEACDLAADARAYDEVRDAELHELPNVGQVVASTIAQDLVSMLLS